MDIQGIFDKVLDCTRYNKYTYTSGMCKYLREAQELKVITANEKEFAINEICAYIGYNVLYLRTALKGAGFPYNFEACLKVYTDWGNKPDLTKYREKLIRQQYHLAA